MIKQCHNAVCLIKRILLHFTYVKTYVTQLDSRRTVALQIHYKIHTVLASNTRRKLRRTFWLLPPACLFWLDLCISSCSTQPAPLSPSLLFLQTSAGLLDVLLSWH